MKLSLYRAHRSKKLKDSGLNFREPDKIFLKENHQMCRFSANLCSYKIFLKKKLHAFGNRVRACQKFLAFSYAYVTRFLREKHFLENL